MQKLPPHEGHSKLHSCLEWRSAWQWGHVSGLKGTILTVAAESSRNNSALLHAPPKIPNRDKIEEESNCAAHPTPFYLFAQCLKLIREFQASRSGPLV